MEMLSVSALKEIPQPDNVEVSKVLQKEMQQFTTKVVVLDDDPTGVQTVNGIYVYTEWSVESLEEAFENEDKMFFILTNSRSLSEKETKELHREIAENLSIVSKKCKKEFILLSRGDSTLRGHYPLETDILSETLEKHLGISFDGEIFCPFFKEGGRYTLNNIHYVQEGKFLRPAGETEFAKDKSFPFVSSDLAEYIEEKSCGTVKKEDCISISLEELRNEEYNKITEKLLCAKNGMKIIVNAVDYIDLKVFSVAWIRSMRKGHKYLVRCAASLPKVIGEVSEKPLLSARDLCLNEASYGGIIVVGSHVKKTTDQFECIVQSGVPVEMLEFQVGSYWEKGGLREETLRVLKQVEKFIKCGKSVLVYTTRQLMAPKGWSKEELLALSVEISDSLTSIISLLTVKPSFILAKGGITSSDVATIGLHVKKALVMGQIKPGIPVWKIGEESKFPKMPYIIFPGNVGEVSTLKEIIEELI